MTNFSLHTSSSSIGGEAHFAMNTRLDVNYSLFKSKGDSDLALEAAKAKQKVCKAEKYLADCILEHQSILLDLWRHHAEVANCHLLNADLNVGHMHMERKKSGIAAFAHSDSGLMFADRLVLKWANLKYPINMMLAIPDVVLPHPKFKLENNRPRAVYFFLDVPLSAPLRTPQPNYTMKIQFIYYLAILTAAVGVNAAAPTGSCIYQCKAAPIEPMHCQEGYHVTWDSTLGCNICCVNE
ncbi:uncharacterized protein EDB93DRAFT_1334662 [Suillus bovinus]|uniref:uncharacterized protein n=1 Tax=Suillus bovinus TaxID=48563 RepID=UPI001B876CBB|nr:uncharacterized protein EDB93DRAFT_1334662 [Suillus bovinus]KAG2158272.1 hypothetical protein EDB93DRAFT_1334662 [Suillus bovinus]